MDPLITQDWLVSYSNFEGEGIVFANVGGFLVSRESTLFTCYYGKERVRLTLLKKKY